MTAAVYNTNRAPGAELRARPGYRLSFAGAFASEWVKLSSLRFTWWCALWQLVLGTGGAALTAWGLVRMAERTPGGAEGSGATAEQFAIGAVNQGVVFVGTVVMLAIGVLAVTSEYVGGSVRSTLAADPRRGQVLGAKALVVAIFAAILGLVGQAVAMAAVAGVMSAGPLEFQFGAAAWQAAGGGVFYLVVTALIGAGLGFCLRSAAGGIAVGLGVYFALDMVLTMGNSYAVVAAIQDLLPTGAGALVFDDPFRAPGQSILGGFWGGVADLAGWVVLVLGGGYLLFRHRDA
ncbi:MAG: ABC transporter permease [Bifidobacteriaceae bacterium]|jgi:ABC-2 type transport system permease protein|nr:ABC transporter permease [Bifidobacteriaceae bacterium]